MEQQRMAMVLESEQGKVRDTDQQAHEGEIAEHGNQAIGEMKAHELSQQRRSCRRRSLQV
jgi:hypothetical protein